MADYKIKVELELNGEVTANKVVYHTQLDFAIKELKLIAKRSKQEYGIFIRRRSKVNSRIKILADEIEPVIRQRKQFDIWEIDRLRQKGYNWKQVAKQLNTSDKTISKYFSEHKLEMYEATS